MLGMVVVKKRFSDVVVRIRKGPDARSVSFVAVTQQFNTTTSIGRLTLNVLLSFAQFEREVTGERKGIWMGGLVPLRYEVRERQLVINEAEATTVRHIFTRYCELGSVRLLKEKLDRNGLTSVTSCMFFFASGRSAPQPDLPRLLNDSADARFQFRAPGCLSERYY
jgi:hypothetical protein